MKQSCLFRSTLFRRAIAHKARLRCSARLAAAVLATALSVGGAPAPVQADPFVATLPVSLSGGPTTVLEGTSNLLYTFAVTNNTSHTLSVDFASAFVQYVSGDVTDRIQFDVKSNGNPLLESSVFAPGSVRTFGYILEAPGVPDGTRDVGVYDLNFFVELSDIPQFVGNQAVTNAVAALLLGSKAGNIDQQNVFLDVALCASQNNCGTFAFLYPPSQNPGFNIVGGAATIGVTITDVPEPSSVALISTLILALIGFGWRKSPACRRNPLTG
jgi:hypothetical protein